MAEPKPVSTHRLQLEYHFDRLLPDKLAQVYQLLVPSRRRAIGGVSSESDSTLGEVNDEQVRGDLCSSVFRPAEGAAHDRRPDSGI